VKKAKTIISPIDFYAPWATLGHTGQAPKTIKGGHGWSAPTLGSASEHTGTFEITVEIM